MFVSSYSTYIDTPALKKSQNERESSTKKEAESFNSKLFSSVPKDVKLAQNLPLNYISNYKALMFDLTVKGGMGGKELIRKVRELDAHIPVFVISGYFSDPIMANPQQFGFTDALSKPFNFNELSKLLSRYL